MSEATTSTDAVLCRVEGALGRITLNRPSALNALTAAMRLDISNALTAWQKNPMIYAIVIDAEGERAFCAGGDLHEMHTTARATPDEALRAAGQEYALNWQIDCYTKPIVSLMDGLCMGSGVGLTAYGTHRVAGPRYSFAMPETVVGFFPDVGATWLLGQLEGHAGLYLGLSGRSINRATALRLGLVTHCMSSEQFELIRAGLREAEPVDALLDERSEIIEEENAEHDWTRINRAFEAATLPDLMAALDADASEFAQVLVADLKRKSPLSLAVTFKQLTDARPGDLAEALQREYCQAAHALQSHDFHEGVRALLIDKDNMPNWEFSSIHDVPAPRVDEYFGAPSVGGLQLPPRPQAIAAIV